MRVRYPLFFAGGEPPQATTSGGATTIRRKRLTLYVNDNLLSLAGTKEHCRDGHWPSFALPDKFAEINVGAAFGGPLHFTCYSEDGQWPSLQTFHYIRLVI